MEESVSHQDAGEKRNATRSGSGGHPLVSRRRDCEEEEVLDIFAHVADKQSAERIPRRHKMLEAEIEHVVHVCVKLSRISALAFLRRECVMTHRRRVEQRQSFAVRGNRLALRVGGDRATAIVPSFSHLRSVKRTSKASLVPLSCVRSSTGETPVVDQARPFGFF